MDVGELIIRNATAAEAATQRALKKAKRAAGHTKQKEGLVLASLGVEITGLSVRPDRSIPANLIQGGCVSSEREIVKRRALRKS